MRLDLGQSGWSATTGRRSVRSSITARRRALTSWTAGWRTRNQEISSVKGIKENRSQWFIQGHIGSTWKDNQYFRTRDMKYVRPAFEDLLKRLQTDYIDLGMIHYVDSEEEWEKIQHSDYLDYVMELKEKM